MFVSQEGLYKGENGEDVILRMLCLSLEWFHRTTTELQRVLCGSFKLTILPELAIQSLQITETDMRSKAWGLKAYRSPFLFWGPIENNSSVWADSLRLVCLQLDARSPYNSSLNFFFQNRIYFNKRGNYLLFKKMDNGYMTTHSLVMT